MSRFLYRKPLPEFIEDAYGRAIDAILAAELDGLGWNAPSESERRSWVASLPALATVLQDPALLGSEIFVELFMPLSSARCDVLLTGRRSDGRRTAALIELKQWSHVQAGPFSEHVRLGAQVSLHPSAQARDYVTHLRHFHSAFAEDDGVVLKGAVYMHNMGQGKALQLLRDPMRFGLVWRDYPIFAAGEEHALVRWLQDQLVPGPGVEAAERIAAGRPLPSPKLLDLLVRTIQANHEWALLDEQRTVYWAVRDAVQKAKDSGEKAVIVVRGGPGTGKSVLAIQLLADAARQHWRVVHATGSKAFQTVLQGKTLHFSTEFMKRLYGVRYKNQLPVQDLFATFANVAKASLEHPDALDLVVADESHRLWERRRMKYPNGSIKWLSEEPMVREVISAAKVSAFFLDDNQSVRPNEIGHSRHIIQHATAMGVPVLEFDLNLQFRCSGSESYVNWVDGLLGYRGDNDLEWHRYEAYGLQVARDMSEVDDDLRRKQREGFKCRIIAGYCWRWSKPSGVEQLVHDVTDPRFGDWSAPWIAKTGQHLKPLDHRYYKWATNDEQYEEVGSIYSVQGFEFDYIGLIWGEDLVRRDGEWVAQLEHNRDHAFKRELRTSGEDPVAKLLNVYRVLLTRGMLGTSLFILDEETRAYVQSRLELRAARRGAELG